jgi:hypothetical protein
VSADERLEQLIAFVGSQLPAPVEQDVAHDGSMIFTGGAPAEVVVHVTGSSVVISEFAGYWEAPGRFVVKPRRVGSLKWRRLPESAMMSALSTLIKAARELRIGRFRPCSVCHAKHPPEALFGDDVCAWCSDQSTTVVH